VGNASHELRTPVAATLASVEALCDGALTDPTAGPAFLEAARRNALRLSRLVDDLLDLSRLDSETLEIVTHPVPLGPVVAGALDGVRFAAEAKKITLDDRISPGISALAEEGALGQILQNLLDNAVKYTPEGGRVTVEAGPFEDGVRISVRDTGPGIPPQHQDRIFERFYRVDTARSRSLGGTGLGLAIVRHLAERMEGEVTLECPELGGSVFSVVLPPTHRG
jgi:two-component system phosphate regulon sensor histidine kinase PhoR